MVATKSHLILLAALVFLEAASLLAQPSEEAPRVPDSEVGVNAMILIGEPAGPPRSGDELARITEIVAGVMRCPVCQGLSVADSPSKTAVAMKGEVRELLAAGYSPDQVLRYFEQSYGEFVLLEPKAEGFNLVVWITPVVALAAGILFVLWHLAPKAREEVAVDPEDPGAVDEGSGAGSGTAAPAGDPELAAYRERVRREVGA